MNKLLIELFVPAVNQTFDIEVPPDMKVHLVEHLLASLVAELSNAAFAGTEDTTLCHRHTGKPLDVNMTLPELGVRNGSTLMLI